MSLSQLLIWNTAQTGAILIKNVHRFGGIVFLCQWARQQHVNNRFIVLKKAQGQRHNSMGGCVIICRIFNASLFAVHFSLPTKSRYFHALSPVQVFILMSGFQCVLLFIFLSWNNDVPLLMILKLYNYLLFLRVCEIVPSSAFSPQPHIGASPPHPTPPPTH